MSEDETKVVVLVADDEPSTLALVASHVRSKGYEVLEASDGDQAWQLAHEHLPHLVILDVMMPGMSGWEVCRKIREAVSLAHTGVIMLTGIGENLNEMTSPLYGADTYLDKPFEFTELDQRIDDTLTSRKEGAMGRPDTSEPQSSRPGNGMAAQPSLAKATMRSEPPPPYDDDEIDGDDEDDEDDEDLSDDDETSSDDSSADAAPAPSQDDDDEEPATMPKPKLRSQAPKKASKGVIAKAASGVGAFLEKAAKILQQPKGKAPKKAAPAKAAKKAAPKAAKKAAPKAAKKAAPKAAKKAAPKAAKKAAPKKAAKPAAKAAKKGAKAVPKKAAKPTAKAAKKGAKAAPKKAAPKKAAAKATPVKATKTAAKKAPLAKAKPEAKKAASKPKPKASSARPTRPSPSGGNVTA